MFSAYIKVDLDISFIHRKWYMYEFGLREVPSYLTVSMVTREQLSLFSLYLEERKKSKIPKPIKS